jgi:hypothetical protein
MFANMQDEGCPGQWLDTPGSTVNGSNEVAVPATNGWKLGSGLAVYDPGTQKGFKGRVAEVKGTSLVLDTAATFTSMNAVVSSDDSVVYAAVYAKAKAAGGGTIFWPAGIYRVGAKDEALPDQAFRNTPLFVSSRIRNIGEGAGNTILKLADEVNMLWPGNPARPLTVCEFWTCGPVFMNEGNRWWFNPHGVSKQNPPYDTQIEISGMTIDCNKDNQSRVYKPFFSGPSAMQADNIHQEYPDSMYWAGVNLGGGMLDPNGFYNPFFRFLDAGGAEGPPNQYGNYRLKDTGAPDSNALRLFLPPPTVWPPTAVAIVVYIGRFDDPDHSSNDSPTNEFDPCGNPRYEMLAPILLSNIQAWDGNPAIDHWPHVDILSHTHFAQGPVETQGNYRIPGRITSPGDASASSSMSLDQIHDSGSTTSSPATYRLMAFCWGISEMPCLIGSGCTHLAGGGSASQATSSGTSASQIAFLKTTSPVAATWSPPLVMGSPLPAARSETTTPSACPWGSLARYQGLAYHSSTAYLRTTANKTSPTRTSISILSTF